jgi:CubicO group peptidase (beta-lactamase class C family)
MASTVKTMTAVALLTLVDDGIIGLDDLIHPVLPEFNDVEMVDITLRHLLSHTSGLTIGHPCASDSDGADQFDGITLRECAQLIAARGPFAIPGTKFRYSNPAFSVAGALAEEATGRSWNDLFRERVGGPLGFRQTRFGGDQNPPLGGGGWSTAVEYARLMRMVANGGSYNDRQVLSPQIVAEMLRDQNVGVEMDIIVRSPELHYGLGIWRELVDANGNVLMASSLGSTGFAAWIDFRRDVVGVMIVPPSITQTGGLIGGVWSLIPEIIPEN